MKEIICAQNAPKAIGPYSHAVSVEGIVFTSGQLGIDPSTGALLNGVEAQAEQALINLSAVLETAGASLDDVVKTTVFVKDLADFGSVNAIYAKHFTGQHPARSCVQVAALPMGALVEVEAIAFKSADETVSF
ncbi:MAG: RidA family protein [Clostridia bacterium]|nr:RidA family protein [Clostridia bacterium]